MSYSQYFAIEKRLLNNGVHIGRKDLISSFTGGRTDSLKDLSNTEYSTFINYLNNRYPWLNSSPKKPDKSPKSDEANTKRRKIIAMAHQMYWYNDLGKIDVPRINSWCKEYGKYKKVLNDHSSNELSVLITQFQQVLDHHLKA